MATKKTQTIGGKAPVKLLEIVHNKVASYMIEQLDSGEDLSSGDVSNILKFLKDNNISADISESKPLQNLSYKIEELLKEANSD